MPDMEMTKWRKQINLILLFLAVAVTFLELLIYFHEKRLDALEEPHDAYFMRTQILYPALVNCLCLLLNFRLQSKETVKESVKNNAVVMTLLVICSATVWTNSMLVSTLAFFSLPVLMSSMLADRKRMYVTSAASLLVMSICTVRTYDLLNGDPYLDGNILLAYFFFLLAFLTGILILAYIEEKKDSLFSSYQTQLILNRRVKMDPLTNLYNQNTFFHQLNESVARAGNQTEIFSVAILDIDDFKSINDTYGHSAGNRVLEGLSDLMALVFSPKKEFVARYGGEEFGIIFYGMTQEEACERIEQLRRHFSGNSISRIGSIQVTFSGGIAQYRPGEEGGKLFNRADAALYEAKRRGKNRTVADFAEEVNAKVLQA